jgi:DNA-binding transcriptional ArsR family regulator
VLIAGIRKDHVGFGFSPARECLRGIRVLLFPAGHAEQMPWVRETRRRFPKRLRASIERFRFFFELGPETFPSLWDERRSEPFESELKALRSNLGAYRNAIVIRLSARRLVSGSDLQRMRSRRWYRPAALAYAKSNPWSASMLEQFVDSPEESLRDFCEMLRDFHEHAFVPAWSPIHERLTADIEMRKRLLREFGVTALLRTLSAQIVAQQTRSGSNVELGPGAMQVHLEAGDSIVLTPSFFCWPAHEVYLLETPAGKRGTIAYPVPPLTTIARRLEDRDALARTCAALGDPVRLRMMELLSARELSTRELASFLKLSQPVVSRHLHALLHAELVAQRRSSYFVLYSVRREHVRRFTEALSPLC